MVDFENLRNEITRDNAIELLVEVPCPVEDCGVVGNYMTFHEMNNNGIGIRCVACGKYHPFIKQHIMWLRSSEKRRANDIVAVARDCGAYCYICGATFEELLAEGIGLSVHHTRSFAEHGEAYKKIPLCSECHEIANFMQRIRRRRLERK